MKSARLAFSAVIAVLFLCQAADAQLFQRIRENVQERRQARQSYRQSARAERTVTRSSDHWGYPGSLAGHLSGTHGVTTTGMTRSQMLVLHDSLHENARVSTAADCPSCQTTTTHYQAYQAYTEADVIGNLVLNGGETVQSATERVRAPVFGCPNGQCTIAPTLPALPTMQPKPAPVPVSSQTFGLRSILDASAANEIPDFILAQVDEPKKTAKDSFRSNLADAIEKARKDKKITVRQAVRLRVAMLSPAFVEQAHDLAVTQIAFSGETSEAVPVDEAGVIQVEGINWDGLIAFLEAFIPLLLTLLKAFGMAA